MALSREQINARLVAYDEAIEHLGDNNAFEDVTEREQAKIVAAQPTNQRDRFFKLHAKTLTKGE